MSGYTPMLAGVRTDKKGELKTAVDFTAQACVEKLPAILRVKVAEGQPSRVAASAMSIQMHATTAASALSAAVSDQRAYLRMEGVERSAVAARAALAADPELLLQIPRLKETLLALDSEMHATASSDVDKRLLMHERIMQLQGAQLTKVQKAYEQTVRSVEQIMDSHALHGQLHEVAGRKVLQTEAATRGLLEKSELHSRLHHASAASVFGLEHSVQRLQESGALHGQIHQASGARVMELQEDVLGLQGQMRELGTTSVLHSQLHTASGGGVLQLRAQVAGLGATSALHSQLHKASGGGVLELQTLVDDLSATSQLHSDIHLAVGAKDSPETAAIAAKSGAVMAIDGEELRHLRAEMDALASQNEEHAAAISKFSQMHASQAKIMRDLGTQKLQAGGCQGAGCADADCRCTACAQIRAHSTGHTEHKPTSRAAEGLHSATDALKRAKARATTWVSHKPGAVSSSADDHRRILAMLDKDIKSSNGRHNRNSAGVCT